VDDDQARLEQVRDLLHDTFKPCSVYLAHDGMDGLRKLGNDPPHLLITSLDLPRLSGTELVRMALKKDGSPAIIVLTDVAEPNETSPDLMPSERVRYCQLPLDPQRFLEAVNRSLESLKGNVAAEFRTSFLNKGQVLFREGDAANAAYLLKKGKLRALLRKDGKEIELGDVLPGEFVGEMAHITGEPRSADVEAAEHSELVEIPLGTLDILLFSKPAWSRALMKSLVRRLKGANTRH
jgi:DNA-binding response OmpR family regulator